MTPREALTVVDRFAREEEIDELIMDLLRYPSPQTELLEADPQLKKFIAGNIAPRLAELTGSAGAIDPMGNLIWRMPGANGEGFMLMGYAMTFPAASMKQPFSGALREYRILIGKGDERRFLPLPQSLFGRGHLLCPRIVLRDRDDQGKSRGPSLGLGTRERCFVGGHDLP